MNEESLRSQFVTTSWVSQNATPNQHGIYGAGSSHTRCIGYFGETEMKIIDQFAKKEMNRI